MASSDVVNVSLTRGVALDALRVLRGEREAMQKFLECVEPAGLRSDELDAMRDEIGTLYQLEDALRAAMPATGSVIPLGRRAVAS